MTLHPAAIHTLRITAAILILLGVILIGSVLTADEPVIITRLAELVEDTQP